MEPKIYHGKLTPGDFAEALMGEFNRGPLRAQRLGNDNEMVVQILTKDQPLSGGPTALSVTLRKVEDGVAVQIGKQAWLGVAASLGQTAFQVWRNPLRLLDRLDDLAQDIDNLKLSERVWEMIDETARALGASFELSERLRRLVCVYCQTANPVGEPSCIACGAPLGPVQPRTCKNCGFVIKNAESLCPNCGKAL